MKFATIKEHRDFFQKQGWIEFEGLISTSMLDQINEAINQSLSQRLKISLNRIQSYSVEELFLQGHDLWRSHPTLQKFVTQVRFAEIAAQLIERKSLRLGFDQFYPPLKQEYTDLHKERKSYVHVINETNSLENVSSYNNLACGVMIALDGDEQKEQNINHDNSDKDGIDIFPKLPGHVIFFQPTVPVRWDEILCSFQRYYLISYTQASAYYHMQVNDPHLYAPKRLGYNFNDKLNDKFNPIVYR